MKNTNPKLKIMVILTIIILGFITILVIVNKPISETVNENTKNKSLNIKGQPTLGELNAPVTIVEFGDFKCPACKEWGEIILPQLEKDYIDTGKIKFSYINVMFHGEESKLTSLAAESVFKNFPNEYWDFHKNLFKMKHTETVTSEKILELAKENSNIDIDMLKIDIEQQTKNKEVIIDSELVKKHNIQQTPTIFINDIIITEPFNYENLKKVIENELKEVN